MFSPGDPIIPFSFFIFSWVARWEISKPGLGVIGSVALVTIYAFFSEHGFTPYKIQTVLVLSFQLLSGFWRLTGPVFQNRDTVSRTKIHSIPI